MICSKTFLQARWLSLASALVLFGSSGIFADDELLKFAKDYNKKTIAELSIKTAGAGKSVKLKSHPDPVLKWSSSRNGYLGCEMFVWAKDERPVAITGFLHWPNNSQAIWEFINVSDESLEASSDGDEIWESDGRNAVRWRPLEGAKSPMKSASIRLTQMRRLAEKFKVHAVKGPPSYEEDSVWHLRLVPEPIYRYQPKKDEVIDGAVFSFAQETDAEAFLVLEARSTDDGTHWYYAFARVSPWKLVAEYNKKQAWSVDRIEYPIPQGLGYFQVAWPIEYPKVEDENYQSAPTDRGGLPIEY